MLKLLLFPLLLSIAVFATPSKGTLWQGVVSNGQKTEKVSFIVSPDGKQLSQLTFSGYRQCSSGKPGQFTIADAFDISAGKVSAVVEEATQDAAALGFSLQAEFSGRAAVKGRLRISNPLAGCEASELEWAAAPVGPAL